MDNEQVNEHLRKISQGILEAQQAIVYAPDSFHDRVDTAKLEQQLLAAKATVSKMFKLGLGPTRTDATK